MTNPYYPLLPGMRWEYRGVKDGRPLRDVVVVTKRIERIGGVPCAVVIDRVYVDGRLAESTIDWFAQDGNGTVWYFGEATQEVDRQGRVDEHGGLVARRHQRRPAGSLHARAPTRGAVLRAGALSGPCRGPLQDRTRARRRSASRSGPSRTALMTEEWTPLEPGVLDAKWYVKGIGEVKEATLKGGDERAELVSFRRR